MKTTPETPTPTQQGILKALLSSDRSLADLISAVPGAAPGNISTQVSWARKRHWIDSVRDPVDARRSVYKMTDAGRAALEAGQPRDFTPKGAPRAAHHINLRIPLDGSMAVVTLDNLLNETSEAARTLLIDSAIRRHTAAEGDAAVDVEGLAAELGVTKRTAQGYVAKRSSAAA